MTREDIIRMAREAGFPFNKYGLLQGNEEGEIDADENLERFAALVAAHIRETEFKPDWNNYRQGLADGAAAEREACAKVADDHERERCKAWAKVLTTGGEVPSASLSAVAAAIRARGQA